MSAPLVSVLMPVRNARPTIAEAVRAVLGQTMQDFELLVCDDASTDGSMEVVEAFGDPRIRILRGEGRAGVVDAVNACIDAARGEFLANMDADDRAHPRRFEKQLRYLRAHREVGVCGTWMTSFGAGASARYTPPEHHEEIVCDLLFHPSPINGTAMFRASLRGETDLHWGRGYPRAEDYDWLLRLSRVTRFANIPEPLYEYRMHPAQIRAVHAREQHESTMRLHRALVEELLPDVRPDEFALHVALTRWFIPRERASLGDIHAWLLRLDGANRQRRVYDPATCTAMLARRFFFVCDYYAPQGFAAWREFRRLSLHRLAPMSARARLAQFVHCLTGRDVPGRRLADGGVA
jgi:glycosyltransferase involved in cell wall biosynthesis